MNENLPADNPFQYHDQKFPGRLIGHGGADATIPPESAVVDVVAQWERDDWSDSETKAVVRLIDGRYCCWESWLDITFGGFEDGDVDVHFANDLETIIRFGLTDEGREQLGLKLP